MASRSQSAKAGPNIKQTSQQADGQAIDDAQQEEIHISAQGVSIGSAHTSGCSLSNVTKEETARRHKISSTVLTNDEDNVDSIALLCAPDCVRRQGELAGDESGHLRSRAQVEIASPLAGRPQAQLISSRCMHNVSNEPLAAFDYLSRSVSERRSCTDRCALNRLSANSSTNRAASRSSLRDAVEKGKLYEVQVELSTSNRLFERVSRLSFIRTGRSSIASARSSLVRAIKGQRESISVLTRKSPPSSQRLGTEDNIERDLVSVEQQLEPISTKCQRLDCGLDATTAEYELRTINERKDDTAAKLLLNQPNGPSCYESLLNIARKICKNKSSLTSCVKEVNTMGAVVGDNDPCDAINYKLPVDDKVDAQQDKVGTGHRRSTYSSSMGATTDMQCDSSISSLNNCQHTCPRLSCTVGTCHEATICRLNKSAKTGRRSRNCDLPSSSSSKEASERNCDSLAEAQFKVIIDRDNKSNALDRTGIKRREHWDKNIEFLLAVIGFAVDLGNVWRFPYICYKNGGGAFLIPYTIMFILGGLPIFYLELSLGQYFSSGCLTVWRRVCPMAKGVGYAMCVLNFFTGLYYNTIISWAVFFFVQSFTEVLPWTNCNNVWNSKNCKTIEQRHNLKLVNSSAIHPQSDLALSISNDTFETQFSSPTKDYFEREVLQVHLSTGIDDLGLVRWPLAIYLAIVFVCIYFAIWKGVKSTGKAVWITALLPYFVLIPLLVRGIFLEGAWLGIKYYLYPQWMRLLDVKVWVEAAQQIYFSLGPGFGTLMALSSYNRFNHNCKKDALIAASVNYFASFISGLVIFSVLGYMATIENVSISNVATEGPGLVFQVYPEGLATMHYSSIWSVLFFIMVITLGIDSTFGGLESVITGLCDEYPKTLRSNRGVFIGFLIILLYLFSLPTTTYGGNYVICLLESYGTSLSLLFIVLAETIIVCWLYGADKFCKNLEEMHGESPGAYWRICWKYISPTILLIIFLAALEQELSKYNSLVYGSYTYPSWAPIAGLLMTGSSVCCIPIYAIYYIRTKTSGSLSQFIVLLINVRYTTIKRLKLACMPQNTNRRVEDEIFVNAHKSKIMDEKDGRTDTVI